MPRPGSQVIPDGWSAHHQPVAEGTMTATCEIRDPAAATRGDFDEDTGTRPSTPAAPYYDGRCRVQQQKQPQVGTTGQQKVSTHDYLVVIPASVTTVRAGHLVTITATEDGALVDRVLKVTDVQRGSLIWERDLICIDTLG